MVDFSQMTIDELRAAKDSLIAEEQSRSQKQQLLDQAWNLVLDAKNAGFTKVAVSKALTDVVNQAWA